MPKCKETSSLVDLSLQTLGKELFTRSCQPAVDAIKNGRKPELKGLRDLHEYVYAKLPCVLSHKVTAHMMSVISRETRRCTFSDKPYEFGSTNLKNLFKAIILAFVSRDITLLDITDLTLYAQRILTSNIHKHEKLQTLIVSRCMVTGVSETLPQGLSSLKCLVNFRMQYICTDEIIEALGQSCSGSIELIDVKGSDEVTNGSFKILKQFHKLKHLSIRGTSMAAEDLDQFLQYKKCNDTGKGLLSLSVGGQTYNRNTDFDNSSRHLSNIAITCPMLKKLELNEIIGNMETLVSLTELEVLEIEEFIAPEYDSSECNLDGFLRLRGSNLISLRLNADFVDLICILNHCINLKEIVINFFSEWNTSLEIAANACQKLEILEIIGDFSPSSIERMLYACVNLKRLGLCGSEEEITDEFILRLLSHNHFLKLESFRAEIGELSMISANALIDQCPLLKEILWLPQWNNVTESDINMLRNRVKNNNLDLTFE